MITHRFGRRLATAGAATLSILALGACAQSSAPAPTRPASGAASATPASTVAPVLRAYEFPGGMIAGDEQGQLTYTRLNALVALPSTPGPHPVAIVVHGSYPSCIEAKRDRLLTSQVQTTLWVAGCGAKREVNDHGVTSGPDYVRTPSSLAYLAKALAERGIVAVVPDVNSKERVDWGLEPDPFVLHTNLVKKHLEVLERLNGGDGMGLSWGKDLQGKLDLTSLSLIGHSSGGRYVIEAALASEFPNLKAAVALEPAINMVRARSSSTVPTMVIAGQCDEQIPWTRRGRR